METNKNPDRAGMTAKEELISKLGRYWRKNLILMLILLIIWAVVAYGCSILFVEQLNAFTLAGFPLGFWFAQQGAIYVFVILVFVYFFAMERLDKEFDVDE
jgi:putative solute:sodium symporter small subunit